MKLILSLLFLNVLACVVAAQEPSPTPARTNDEVVRISTTLVQVDATVTDRKGKVVRGLNAADFEIYVNGQKQKITSFSFVDSQSKPVNEGKPPNAQNADKLSNTEKLPPLPEKLKPEQIRRTVALVVDDLGLSFGSI